MKTADKEESNFRACTEEDFKGAEEIFKKRNDYANNSLICPETMNTMYIKDSEKLKAKFFRIGVAKC